jgi:hypothetical protein
MAHPIGTKWQFDEERMSASRKAANYPARQQLGRKTVMAEQPNLS